MYFGVNMFSTPAFIYRFTPASWKKAKTSWSPTIRLLYFSYGQPTIERLEGEGHVIR
jgi:hypothetical protein